MKNHELYFQVKTKHLSETPKPEIIASTTPLPSPSVAPDLPTPQAKGVALPSTPLTSDVKRVKSRIKRSSLHESLQVSTQDSYSKSRELQGSIIYFPSSLPPFPPGRGKKSAHGREFKVYKVRQGEKEGKVKMESKRGRKG